MNWIVRTHEDGHAVHVADDLPEQLEALATQLRCQQAEARHIPARPGETGNQSRLHRLAHGDDDDGDRGGRSLRRAARGSGS